MRDQTSSRRSQFLRGDQTLGPRPVLEVLAVRPAFLVPDCMSPRSDSLLDVRIMHRSRLQLPSGHRVAAILTGPAAGRSSVVRAAPEAGAEGDRSILARMAQAGLKFRYPPHGHAQPAGGSQ